MATGVLITEPRGILCDRYPLGAVRPGDRVPVRTRDGLRRDVFVERVLTDHPFGPVLLRQPDDWAPHPVTVEPAPIAAGDLMRAAVFAGDRPGISAGVAEDVSGTPVRIDPIGDVGELVSLRLAVAPGSSGAPVVDDAMHLRGIIVSGALDPRNPLSFMDPASRWHARLSGRQAGIRASDRRSDG